MHASMPTTEDIKPHYSQSNSHDSNREDAAEELVIADPSAPAIVVVDDSLDFQDDDEYYAQFDQPDDSTEDFGHVDIENDEIYLSYRLTRKQFDQATLFEETPYQRTKRSNKKMNAHCQIKIKEAKSVKFNSHNKQLYMHHRLFKRVQLDPPSCNYLSTPAAQAVELARAKTREEKKQASRVTHIRQQPVIQTIPAQLRQYAINEQNLSNQASFDATMIAFLLDMQNRDLSPNDYEMLLRLDERVQRKTVDKNILATLPAVAVNETHLSDRCAICMESYALGQTLKLLPCKHLFHVNCIETYLKEFSAQCPLDNLSLV